MSVCDDMLGSRKKGDKGEGGGLVYLLSLAPVSMSLSPGTSLNPRRHKSEGRNWSRPGLHNYPHISCRRINRPDSKTVTRIQQLVLYVEGTPRTESEGI